MSNPWEDDAPVEDGAAATPWLLDAPIWAQEGALGEAPPGTPAALGAVPDATGAGNAPNFVNRAVDKAGQMVRTGAKGLPVPAGSLKTLDEIKGRQKGVDYAGGTDYDDSVALFQAASPQEEELYLTRKYGQGNVFKDPGGNWYVRTQDGRLVAPGAAGVKHAMAFLHAEAPPIALGTMGAVAGAPAGPLGAIAGAGIGAAAGQGVTEGYKMARQRQVATPEETAGRVGMAGIGGMAGEGAGRALTGAPGTWLNAWRRFLAGTTPETERMTALTMEAGGIPPVSSFAPESKRLEFKQSLGQKLMGNPAEQRNVLAVEGEVRRVLEASGMAPQQADDALMQIMNPTARLESASAGQPIQAKVRGEVAGMEQEVTRLAADADRQIDTQLKGLQALGRRADPAMLGEDVAAGIQGARSDFSAAASKIYGQVDKMVGDQPLVPTQAIKREARNVIAALPKDDAGNPIFADAKVLQSLKALSETPEAMSFGEAQRIRSMLGDLAQSPDLTPGLPKREFRLLRDSVDVAFDDAAANPAAAGAVRLLRAGDQFYKNGIRKFEDATINKLVQQTKAGMAPDPGVIADQVLKPGFARRAQELRGMVGPDTWKAVGAAEWQNIMKEATDPATRELSPRRLASAMTDRGNLLDVTYGTKLANDMRLFSDRVAARGGKIPAANLTPDNFGKTMVALEQQQAKLDDYLKNNFLAALAKPGEMQDDAIRFIVKPGQESRLAQAIGQLGEKSPEVAAIRQQALKELLNSAVSKTETGIGRKISGPGIEDALAKFTPKQQEMLFPDGLADDIRVLAKEVKFLFPKSPEDQMAAGLAAGTIKGYSLPRYIYRAALPAFWNWALSKPEVVRSLAMGLREPGPKAKAMRGTVEFLVRSGGIEAASE